MQGGVERTRTLVWDVADLDDPLLLKEHFAETIDHNQYVVGNRLYQANLMSGLRVLDISDARELGGDRVLRHRAGRCGVAGVRGAWSHYPFFESGVLLPRWEKGLFCGAGAGEGGDLRGKSCLLRSLPPT